MQEQLCLLQLILKDDKQNVCFSFSVLKKPFLPFIDYGDTMYINASAHCLTRCVIVYHREPRFIANCCPFTHHYDLYYKVNWPSLSNRRLSHWYDFIYKTIIGDLPSYLTKPLTRKQGSYHL